MRIIEFSAGLPFAAVKTVTPNILETACYYFLLWGLAELISGHRDLLKPVRVRRRLQFALLAACLLLSADALYWVNERYLSRDLRVMTSG